MTRVRAPAAFLVIVALGGWVWDTRAQTGGTSPGEGATELAPAAPSAPSSAASVPDRPSGEAPPPTPYAPWYGYNPAPGLPPPGIPPPTSLTPGPEYARRPIEFFPELGPVAPLCLRGSLGNDRCDGVMAGGKLGASVLWRVLPRFAWGATLDLVGFRYQPPAVLGLSRASAAALYLGLLGRVYFAQEGSVEPYAELGIGGGMLARDFVAADGNRYTETGPGPALRLGAGVEFYVGPRLRLGPAIAVTHVFVANINRCPASGQTPCTSVSRDEQGAMSGYAAAVARLTFLFGDEL